jgi:hypothetical protein
MKKIMIVLVIITLFIFVETAYAEDATLNVGQKLNCVGNCTLKNTIVVNITDNTEDIREDIYGTASSSSSEDAALYDPLFLNQTQIKSICNYATIFDVMGDMPPEEFIAYVKSLGYDDETHISLIWSMCQQEYIKRQESEWSKDEAGGLSIQGVIYYIEGAINWLLGEEGTPFEFKEIGSTLDRYFASDRDVYYLVRKIGELQMRIETLEKTMERTASDTFCEAKIEALEKYNLTYVKCGENSTVYTRVNPEEFGYDMIAYSTDTQCEEKWVCTDWSDCTEGTRKRVCVDENDCGTIENKPAEEQACIIVSQPVESKEPEGPTGGFLTVTENPYYLPTIVLFIISLTLTIININLYTKMRNRRKYSRTRKRFDRTK